MSQICIDEPTKTLQIDRLAKTLMWFQKARPNPDDQDFHSQLGVHFEEVAEMVREICVVPDSPDRRHTGELLINAEVALKALADHLKTRENVVLIHPENRVELLDAICDQIVTGVGVAWTQQLNVCDGLDAVNDSNFSKFVDGQPIIVPGTVKKIGKGPDYHKADLAPFV